MIQYSCSFLLFINTEILILFDFFFTIIEEERERIAGKCFTIFIFYNNRRGRGRIAEDVGLNEIVSVKFWNGKSTQNGDCQAHSRFFSCLFLS